MNLDKTVKFIEMLEDGLDTIDKAELAVYAIVAVLAMVFPLFPAIAFVSWLAWKVYIARQHKEITSTLATTISSVMRSQEDASSIDMCSESAICKSNKALHI